MPKNNIDYSNDERQMKMFERKVNKKLIRERLIKWYKRNS